MFLHLVSSFLSEQSFQNVNPKICLLSYYGYQTLTRKPECNINFDHILVQRWNKLFVRFKQRRLSFTFQIAIIFWSAHVWNASVYTYLI